MIYDKREYADKWQKENNGIVVREVKLNRRQQTTDKRDD